MGRKLTLFFLIAIIALTVVSTGFSKNLHDGKALTVCRIVTSDTILSGMVASLLPPDRYSVEAILPPGQCPGHYDVKLSDIEKMKKADLTVSFRGMAFMEKASEGGGKQLIVAAGNRNWMTPDSYIYGLNTLADNLAKRFPEDANAIMKQNRNTIREVKAGTKIFLERIKGAGIFGKSIIASSMQKEPLEWMGFRVAGEYGRPEAMSARDIVRLAAIGKREKAILVVDNLQSGPDAGKGIAETLGVPHVVLTNFPSEKGYLATLGENVNAILSAVKMR
jgi:ABC-type Zn uptake system ZnuABC Zn-binding protein ZnuA